MDLISSGKDFSNILDGRNGGKVEEIDNKGNSDQLSEVKIMIRKMLVNNFV